MTLPYSELAEPMDAIQWGPSKSKLKQKSIVLCSNNPVHVCRLAVKMKAWRMDWRA